MPNIIPNNSHHKPFITREKGEAVVAQLKDADARDRNGIDPKPPYEEANFPRIFARRDAPNSEVVDDPAMNSLDSDKANAGAGEE